MELTIELLLHEMVEVGASDLHLYVGQPPKIRDKNGEIVVFKDIKIDKIFFERMFLRVFKGEGGFARLFEREEIDVTYELSGVGRFRVNIGLAKREPFAVFRLLRSNIPFPEKLGIPAEFVKVVEEIEYGLIFLGGPTGSGKSMTLASTLNYVLSKYREKVITIEDPIEYIIGEGIEVKGDIIQREVGKDTKDFASALRAAMREDPDYIVVGEVRDVETGRYCVLAAETGHVVFTTIHVKDVLSAINRYTGMFPIEEQNYIKMRLIDMLEAVQVQMLLPRKGGGRVLATEFLRVDEEVKDLLFNKKFKKVRALIESGEKGWTMEASVRSLFEKGLIESDVAESYLKNKSKGKEEDYEERSFVGSKRKVSAVKPSF